MGLVTQQDPIGIAGGLNLYGYANGDPVNFSDPFGLCGKRGEEPCRVWFAGVGMNIVPGAGGGASVGVMWDSSQGLAGIGVYGTSSIEGGLDVSTFVEGGSSSNRADFEGVDIESCGGGGAINVCISESADGRTITGQFGLRNTLLPDAPVSGTTGGSGTKGITFGDVVDAAARLAERLQD